MQQLWMHLYLHCTIILIIITLFMSQMYLAENRGSTNWGERKSNQHKSNQIKCRFLVRGENRSTRGKTSRSRVENQQTQPTYDVRSGNRTRATLVEGQCSHHCANTAPCMETDRMFLMLWLEGCEIISRLSWNEVLYNINKHNNNHFIIGIIITINNNI